MSVPILSLRGVRFAYPDGFQAINDISFSIEAGQSLGLVGANGAGKSTLLLMLPGVLLPAAGDIYVLGMRLDKASAPSIRRYVGLVFQDSDDQLFSNSVFDDVAFGPRNMGLSALDVSGAVDNALEMTGIAHLSSRAAYKLSGGEKRLASIATILSMDPKLIVMDEPSSSLDPKARRKLIELLRRLPQTRIIASHDLDLVWDVCSRVIVLKDGKVAADGETRTILSDERLLDECGLELPLGLGTKLSQ
ncbi:MAG: energy-coupling factor ABC transporter ATP-binding protein [Anaerolineae bacterium]